MTDPWDTLLRVVDTEKDEAYDAGFRDGYAEAIRVARAEVKGKSYSRAVRSLLTKLHTEFKAIF